MIELDAEQVRVLGCLLEKERTVPDSYPMTLNSLVTACNQSSNRFPVVAYDAATVQRTVDSLKDIGLLRFVHPSHGERTTKYRQVIDERLALLPTEAAILSVLFVRGAQTIAEIRTRTERLHAFDSAEEVVAALEGLARRDEPLARPIDRRPGEREGRWTHVFTQEDAAPAPPAPASVAAGPATRSSLEARIDELESKVANLYRILGEEEPPPTL